MASDISIMLVDDEPDFLNGLARLIQSEYDQLRLLTASSGKEALALLEKSSVALLITDLQMPEMDGMMLLERVQRTYPEIKVIILTGFGTIQKAVEAVQLGAFDFLTKPVTSEQLYRSLTKALDFIRLERENSQLRALLSKSEDDLLLGESLAIAKVRQALEAAADADYPVLIDGESGTGKELAARMLHKLSKRAERPYVSVNCPAIADSLLESELFGHCKGAFTGADRNYDGLLLSANQGSVHLDEIGDISPAMQTKLLRFLQEGEVKPVGSNQTRQVDVRVIASTNQVLEAKVEDNSFRADLFYRLNVITIHMPPLSQRSEDVPLLARYFFEKTLTELHSEEATVDPAVLSYLASRDWPGNVRELQNYIRRLVVFSDRHRIDMGAVQRISESGVTATQSHEGAGQYKEMKSLVCDRFSHSYLQDLLASTGGNVSEASRLSGLSRVAIQKMCQRLKLDIDQFRS